MNLSHVLGIDKKGQNNWLVFVGFFQETATSISLKRLTLRRPASNSHNTLL